MMILLSCLLLAVSAVFLARRNRLPGIAMLLISTVPLFITESTAKALFTWLALAGLTVMVVVILRGIRPSIHS